MSDEIRAEKHSLRAELRARRARLTLAERKQASRRACARLMASPIWENALRVGLFLSMHDEVSTQLLLESAWRTGRRVATPVTPPLGSPLAFRWVQRGTLLRRARFGALEPGPDAEVAPLDDLELLVVPGLGFDARGARLGAGGAYYDRTLPQTGPAVMLAFSLQQLDRVPEEPHDVRVQAVVTERGWTWPGAPGQLHKRAR
ncbi:MAG: 5-formyltetrahydrofolate cyclo-ligase [Alphaproteobacteria bacterium]|nr:5-formyltetrahydrofolate cyclo-ligase [Alphaproteobacteria bacterium]